MEFIINNSGLIVFLNGRPLKIERTHRRYAEAIEIVSSNASSDQKIAAINNLLTKETKILEENGISLDNGEIFYNGEKLHPALSKKIKSLIDQGLSLKTFEKFWVNLQQNPSNASVEELFDFLAHKELPITEDGCFLAYKGLRDNFWSKTGNRETKVLKGQVNDNGNIYNGIGEEIEVERNNVDDDRRNQCSHGLHVGALSYAKSFSGGKVVVVKVNPKDVVSVPTDESCRKCRVAAYKVISEFEEEIVAAATTDTGVPMINPKDERRERLKVKIATYLFNKKASKVKNVHVQRLQNGLSPDYSSRVEILDILKELGYVWTNDFVIIL